MTGITNGQYRIRLAAEPSPLIGVDLNGAPVAPVVTKGNSQIWNFRRLEDGNFAVSIGAGNSPFFAEASGGNLVAGERPFAYPWFIQGPDGGPYTIQVFDNTVPPTVWTVNDPYRLKAPVTLRPLEGNPQIPEKQKWYILRVLPE